MGLDGQMFQELTYRFSCHGANFYTKNFSCRYHFFLKNGVRRKTLRTQEGRCSWSESTTCTDRLFAMRDTNAIGKINDGTMGMTGLKGFQKRVRGNDDRPRDHRVKILKKLTSLPPSLPVNKYNGGDKRYYHGERLSPDNAREWCQRVAKRATKAEGLTTVFFHWIKFIEMPGIFPCTKKKTIL